ncbi:MAG: class IV adenylate cyclase [Methanosphaera sp.]|nr:class IV adenylate cyclase [Methanosphaera sp.]
MIEVEVKAKVNEKIEVLKKIDEMGAVYSHTEKQYDIYYNPLNKSYEDTDEALRIREIPDGEEFKRILTYKGPKIDSKSKTRKEVEVTIDNTDNMNEILNCIGFKAAAVVNKTRRIFNYNDYTITLDKLDGLGYYMEIEYVATEDDDIKEIRDNIIDVFSDIGITDGFERESYLELLEKNRE